jgi:hypothetical protein
VSSSKKQTIGYRYIFDAHFVWFHGVADALKRIRFDKRVAWEGNVANGDVSVVATELFGGIGREGGVQGTVEVMNGSPAQGFNAFLASTVGGLLPAFRGVTSTLFKRFDFGMNPYIKPVDMRWQRIYFTGLTGEEQWYPEKAGIPSYITSAPEGAPFSGSFLEDHVYSYALYNASDWVDLVAAGVDYSAWATGAADFDSHDDTTGTEVPEGTNLGFVLRFQLPPGITQFNLDAAYLDDIVYVYNNGIQIASTSTFPVAISVTDPDDFSLTAPNEIAIRVHDTGGGRCCLNSFTVSWEGAEPGPGQFLDMNPSHIIREGITDPDWGMGWDPAEVDDTSFTAAADTLFAEGMGMSILWDRQMPVIDFIKEVVRHINAAVFVSLKTGKFKCKLIRDDYDVETIPVLNKSNVSRLANLDYTTVGELCNSVSVVFWDGANSGEGSLTESDPALVQMQGATINTTIQYPGFSNPWIARRVALRDLRTLSTPLRTCTVYADRTALDLELADVFVLEWPADPDNPDEEFLPEPVVMRIVGIAYGSGTSNQVRMQCTQDVFALPLTGTVEPPGVIWVDPVQPPQDTDAIAMEAPYYELVQRLGEDIIEDKLADDPDVGYVLATAARSNAEINLQIWSDSGAGYARTGVADFSPVATLAADVGFPGATEEEEWDITPGTDFEFLEVGMFGQVDNELVLVTSLDPFTVSRALLDTVPAEHADGATIVFWDAFGGLDITEYTGGENVDVKLLPSSGMGVLDIDDATAVTVAMDSRAVRPYAPGNVQVNGSYFPTTVGSGTITMTWAHRDRLQQTGATQVIFQDASVGPEAGTTYTVRVYDQDDVLLRTTTGISGTSFAYSNSDETADLPAAGYQYLDYLTVQPRAVWSIRKLISTATNAIRVRRSSDNAEADIGFNADLTLNSTALLAHCGAGSGYITKFYDQTGGGRDLVQATSTKQARIVNAGVYDGKGVLDGTDDAYSCTALSVNTSDKLGVYMRIGSASINRYNNIFELSTNYTSQGGAAAIIYTNATGGGTWEAGMANVNVWSAAALGLSGTTLSINDVMTTIFDRAQVHNTTPNETRQWRASAEKARSSTSAVNATGNFGAFDLYFGARAGGTTGASLIDLHTLVVYTVASLTERANIESYISGPITTSPVWSTGFTFELEAVRDGYTSQQHHALTFDRPTH